ncbi:hypothetical protein AV530_016183 [Patagioenas fasciata monilis]|uniref:Uncharacterized protein n=1 Tax=Patagioenas fasciata monilis TaxID=372326 RepID=A0A1V4JWQ9_PATFA|nr:hypothetical protein AV530_016183 [Patagioenas fasciata monilis]
METYLKPAYYATDGLIKWYNINGIYFMDLSSAKVLNENCSGELRKVLTTLYLTENLKKTGKIPVFSEMQNQEHRQHRCLLEVEDPCPSFTALQKSGLDTTCEEWSVYEKQLSSTFRITEVTPCSVETELAPSL